MILDACMIICMTSVSSIVTRGSIPGRLCGETIVAGAFVFLSQPFEHDVKQTVVLPLIWDAMTLMWRYVR